MFYLFIFFISVSFFFTLLFFSAIYKYTGSCNQISKPILLLDAQWLVLILKRQKNSVRKDYRRRFSYSYSSYFLHCSQRVSWHIVQKAKSTQHECDHLSKYSRRFGLLLPLLLYKVSQQSYPEIYLCIK